MIEITLNENGSVSNREIFIGFTGENLDKTLHFTYPEKYQSYHKYILVNHSVDDTFGVLPINDDKFVVSTFLTSKKYGWELQVMFTEDELDLSAETVDLSPKEGKHQKLFKKIWCGIDRGLYSGEAINAFEEDENVKIFYDKIVAMINNGGTSGGVSSWNDLTDKPFYEDEVIKTIIGETTYVIPYSMNSGLYEKTFDTDLTEYPFNEGEKYIVVINGTEYESTCLQDSGVFGFMVSYSGNIATDVYDEDFIFFIMYMPNSIQIMLGYHFAKQFEQKDANIRIEIKQRTGEVKCLDEKFIPSSIARKSDLDGISVSEEDIANAVDKYLEENPVSMQSLTFTGAVEETYDGSEAKTIDIPMGGGMSVSYDEEKEAIIFSGSTGGESSSSDKRLTLIAEVTTTEDLKSIEITQTDDGTPLEDLNIVKFVVLIKKLKWVESVNYNYFTFKINDESPLYTNISITASNQIMFAEGEFTTEGRINVAHAITNGQQGSIGTDYYTFVNNWLHMNDSLTAPIYSENEVLKKVGLHHASASGLLATGLQVAIYAYI